MAETLLELLVRKFPTAKRETLRQMVRDGRVTVNGARPRGVKMQGLIGKFRVVPSRRVGAWLGHQRKQV